MNQASVMIRPNPAARANMAQGHSERLVFIWLPFVCCHQLMMLKSNALSVIISELSFAVMISAATAAIDCSLEAQADGPASRLAGSSSIGEPNFSMKN